MKIHERVKIDPRDWIIQYLKVVQSPIVIHCLKVSIGSHSKNKIVTKIYYRCLSNNFIIAWLFHLKRVSLKRQGI